MGEADMASGIMELAAAGCNIIVDDLSYFNEVCIIKSVYQGVICKLGVTQTFLATPGSVRNVMRCSNVCVLLCSAP
jgi:hypothetical protein